MENLHQRFVNNLAAHVNNKNVNEGRLGNAVYATGRVAKKIAKHPVAKAAAAVGVAAGAAYAGRRLGMKKGYDDGHAVGKAAGHAEGLKAGRKESRGRDFQRGYNQSKVDHYNEGKRDAIKAMENRNKGGHKHF